MWERLDGDMVRGPAMRQGRSELRSEIVATSFGRSGEALTHVKADALLDSVLVDLARMGGLGQGQARPLMRHAE